MLALPQRVHRAASWHSRRTAVVDGARSLTFAEVEGRTNRLGNALVGLTAQAPGQVAVLLPNSLEFVEADIAILKAGKAKVPINVRLTPDERGYVLGDSQAEILITDPEGHESVASYIENLPHLRAVIVVGDAPTTGARDYESTLEDASPLPPAVHPDPASPGVILYTSGTTGRPKGAATSFDVRWRTTVDMLVDELDIVPGDGMVHAGSMAHGSGSKTLAFFLRGARNIVMPKFDGEAFLALAADELGTHSFLVPTMIASVVDAAQSDGAPAPSTLRTVSYGGAPISASLLRDALTTLGGIFVQVYGSCEAPHPVTLMTKLDHDGIGAERAASIGRESLGVQTAIVGADGEEVTAGEVGELLVGADRTMSGYWNDPAATEGAFLGNMYRTGDLVRRDEEGYLYVVDRQREMIISGGLNIYPAEVERVLHETDGVAEAAVVGVPDDRWGESVLAIVVRKAGASVAEQDLIEHCRARLASYKKPSAVEFRDELPKGSTGKVLKRELRDEYWDGHERKVN